MDRHFASMVRPRLGGLFVALLVMLSLGAAQPPPRAPVGPPPSPTSRPTPTTVTAANPLLQVVAARHQATLGVYVHHLGTDERMELNADQVFRSASLYKLFVLYEVFARLAAGT